MYAHLCCSLTYEFMFPGVTRARNSTYSSEWNWVISLFVAGFARWSGVSKVDLKSVGCEYVRKSPSSCISHSSSPGNDTSVSGLASSYECQLIARAEAIQWTRTDDQDHNEIQIYPSRRSNTIKRFNSQSTLGRGTQWTHHALFGRTVRFGHSIILRYHRGTVVNAIFTGGLVASKGDTNGESLGLLPERVPTTRRSKSKLSRYIRHGIRAKPSCLFVYPLSVEICSLKTCT